MLPPFRLQDESIREATYANVALKFNLKLWVRFDGIDPLMANLPYVFRSLHLELSTASIRSWQNYLIYSDHCISSSGGWFATDDGLTLSRRSDWLSEVGNEEWKVIK